MYKVKPLYEIPKEMDLLKPFQEIHIDFDDATAESSATTTTPEPVLTNGSLGKKVEKCDNILTIESKTPTKAIDEKVTQVDGIVTTNGSPGEGGLENGTGIKKKSSFRVACRNIFIKPFSFLNNRLRRKKKNKNNIFDTSGDDQVDLKQKEQQSPPEKGEKQPKEKEKKIELIVQQSPQEKQPKNEEKVEEKAEEKKITSEIAIHLVQMEKETSEVLEARQLTIISKQIALEDNMTDLHEKALTRNVPGVDATDPGETLPLDYIDVVVNADPQRPPYSLLLFRKILKDFFGAGVRIKTQVHSSCTTPIPAYLKVFNIDEDEVLDGKEALTILIIWKNSSDLQTELVKPIHQIGEGNLARYLSRILPMTSPLNYDNLNSTQLIKVDQLLEDSREQTVNFEGIEEHLKASGGPFLLGQMTIADFVLYSTVNTEIIEDTWKDKINWDGFEGMIKRAHLGPFLLGQMTSEDLLFFSKLATGLIHNYGRILKYPRTQEWLQECQTIGQFQLFNI